jgi:hypothetical protein
MNAHTRPWRLPTTALLPALGALLRARSKPAVQPPGGPPWGARLGQTCASGSYADVGTRLGDHGAGAGAVASPTSPTARATAPQAASRRSARQGTPARKAAPQAPGPPAQEACGRRAAPWRALHAHLCARAQAAIWRDLHPCAPVLKRSCCDITRKSTDLFSWLGALRRRAKGAARREAAGGLGRGDDRGAGGSGPARCGARAVGAPRGAARRVARGARRAARGGSGAGWDGCRGRRRRNAAASWQKLAGLCERRALSATRGRAPRADVAASGRAQRRAADGAAGCGWRAERGKKSSATVREGPTGPAALQSREPGPVQRRRSDAVPGPAPRRGRAKTGHVGRFGYACSSSGVARVGGAHARLRGPATPLTGACQRHRQGATTRKEGAPVARRGRESLFGCLWPRDGASEGRAARTAQAAPASVCARACRGGEGFGCCVCVAYLRLPCEN